MYRTMTLGLFLLLCWRFCPLVLLGTFLLSLHPPISLFLGNRIHCAPIFRSTATLVVVTYSLVFVIVMMPCFLFQQWRGPCAFPSCLSDGQNVFDWTKRPPHWQPILISFHATLQLMDSHRHHSGTATAQQ